jgi:hypothetical protein
MIKLSDYEFIKRPKSDLATDEIMSNIYRKWWDEQGYTTVYYLGAISQLKAMVKNMKDTTSFTKKDLLMIIANTKNYPEAPDEIKNLVDDILEEFDYKENDE